MYTPKYLTLVLDDQFTPAKCGHIARLFHLSGDAPQIMPNDITRGLKKYL